MDRNQTTFRNTRSMPQWVNENHARIGPKPPPPPPINTIPPPLPRKNAPDPDYEVIEFGQQYSNPGLPAKTGETEIKKPGIKCELCGSLKPTIKCEQCQQHLFCSSCDDMYHRHPKRQTHSRKFIDKNFKPPLPPKGEGTPAPLPPPRRHKNKLMGNFLSTNGNHTTNGPKDGQVPTSHMIRPQPPPSPTLSLREKMGSLKRMINPGNRPLPPTPDQKQHSSQQQQSQPETPNHMPSPFDTIRRAPSLTMEKIQNQTTATLDRMTQLQQRYKQHQEAMRSGDSDRSRRTSMASDMDMDMRIDQLRNRQQAIIPNTRNMSSSVQNLNQLNYRQQPQSAIGPGGGWSTTPMQQAQSMAQLNAPPPGFNPWHQPQQPQQMWNNFESQPMNGGSNMSLNLPPPQGYFYPPENRPPPPVWMNTWGPPQMYPYPVGMVPMSPMLGHRSQAPSRAHSRAASPALSLRSRRSMMSNRKSHRSNPAYPKDLTDDEDSDVSDRELSPRSNRDSRSRRESLSHKDTLTRRTRKTSSSGLEFENENEAELSESRFQRTIEKKANVNRIRSPPQNVVTPSPPPPPKIAAPIPVKPKVVAATQSAFQPVKKAAPGAVAVTPKPVVQPSKPQSSSSSEDEEEEDDEALEEDEEVIKESENKIQSPEPTQTTTAPIANLDEDDLGPPPEAPDHEWECEFCTYVNEANTKICLVCCKTPTQVPTKPKPAAAPTPKSPSPKPVIVKSPVKQSVSSNKSESSIKKPEVKKVEPKKVEPKKVTKKTETATETEKPMLVKLSQTKVANEAASKKTTSEESSSDAGKMKEQRPKSPHWIDLLENENQEQHDEASEIHTQPEKIVVEEEEQPYKVSTGCGPSPPRELASITKPITTSPTLHKEVPTKPVKVATVTQRTSVSTGTSPPPQTISTQTYELPAPLTRDRSSHSLRRSHSMVAQNVPIHQTHNDYNTTRSYSRQSFSSDTQSLPMTPPEDLVSPPYHGKVRNKQLLDDEAIAYINRTLNSYGVPPIQRKSVAEGRYRSIHDLRRSDSYRARKMSQGDFQHSQRSRHSQQRQLDDNNITLEDIIALKRQENVAPSGIELIRLLREADQYNFTAEDLQAALTHCGQMNPVTWLRENWTKLIETVQTLATKYGQERPENTIGTISVIEARESLRIHKGNVWHAVTECIEQRTKKFQQISSRGHYSREDIVTSLTAHHGNVEMALVELGKTQLKPFLMKIWGPPSGADNESGNILYDMDHGNRNSMHENGFFADELNAQEESQLKHSNNLNGAFSPMSSGSIISDKKFDDNQINPYHNNSNILRDIESLIGNIEENQAKQNESMMKNIENLLGNILQTQRNSKSQSPFQPKLEIANSYERLNTKSPIVIPQKTNNTEHRIVENDIREFMTQHIQDVSPDLVEHVQQDIRDDELVLILPEMTSPPVESNDLVDHEVEMINTGMLGTDSVLEPINSEEAAVEIKNTVAQPNVSSPVPVEEPTLQPEKPKFKAKVTNKHKKGIVSGRKKSIVVLPPNMPSTRAVYPPIEPTTKDEVTTTLINKVPSIEANNKYESEALEQQTTTAAPSHIAIETATNESSKSQTETSRPVEVVNNTEFFDSVVQHPPVQKVNHTPKSTGAIKKTSTKKQNRQANINIRPTKIPVKRSSNILSPKTNGQKLEVNPSQNVSTTLVPPTKVSVDENNSTNQSDNQDNSFERKTSTATIILQPIANLEQQNSMATQSEVNEKPQTPDSEPNKSDLIKMHQESSIEEDIFEDTEHFDSPPPPLPVTLAPQPSSSKFGDTIDIETDTAIEKTQIESPQPYAIIKQPSQNLSELVMDTQKLIKQMKDEITSDIASYVSDEDYTLRTDEYYDDEDESGSFEWTDDDEEGEGEQSFGEEMEAEEEAEEEEIYSGPENEGDDGWTDVSTNFDSENEENVAEIKEILEEDLNNLDKFNVIPTQQPTNESTNNTAEFVDNSAIALNQNNPIDSNSPTSQNEEPPKIQQLETFEIVEEPPIDPQLSHIEEVEIQLYESEITEVIIPPEPSSKIETIEVPVDNPNEPQGVTDIQVVTVSTETKTSSIQTPKPVKKMLVRKRSLTNQTPITPSNNIKSIQSKFLNNNSGDSKAVPKSSVTGTIPKQLGTTSKLNSTKNVAMPTKVQTQIKQSTPIPSKSQIVQLPGKPTAAQNQNNVSVLNNGISNPKMSQEYLEPKKESKTSKIKYRETCFSDQYETSDDENDNPVEKWPTKEFYKISKTIEDNEALLKEDHEVLIQKFIDEGKVSSTFEAELVVALLELKFDQESAIWASSQCKTIDEAIIILRKDCELCLENYSLNEFVSMLQCSHQLCKNCARNYFSIQITERAITDCTCPYCKIPELHDPNLPEDEVVEYFSNLDIILKNILSNEDHELFQRKLRDRALLQDPNFKWCVECSSGFVASSKHRVLECPDCHSRTCAGCRKPWEDQHKGITCEQYAEWKELNDPEIQNEGFKKHLQMHGLQCPNCKFQYSLVRGGCMHFTCTQCKYEFCYGCSQPFKIGAKCTISTYCAKLGLHAHHPRNCLYFLRDKEPHELQNLLRIHDVPFETESLLEQMQIEGTHHPHTIIRCPIALQKDTPAGLVDTICNGDVTPNNAGLCRNHYIEYLCKLIKNHDIDTIDILTADDLEILVRRANKRMPPRPFGIIEGIYRQYLLQVRNVYNTSIDHFVEYLCNCVRKSNLDPIPILDLNDTIQELRRHFIELPERGPWDTDPIYREMCLKIVQDQIPLN